MPIVLRIGPYSFGFFASDENEPPHVHVRRERQKAKVWLEPGVEVSSSRGFAPHELNDVVRMVSENRELLLERWHDFFNQ
jgi:hypothetical protein